MKKLSFTPAILLLSLVGCEMNNMNVETPAIENEPTVVYATSEGSSTSRTVLAGAQLNEIEWQAGDAMNFYPVVLDADGKITSKLPGDATLQQGFKLSTTDSGKSAGFMAEDENADITKATVTSTDGSGDIQVDATNFFALTPYLDNNGVAASNIKLNKADGGVRPTIYFRMPAEQVYVKDSYDPAVAFAFAKTTSLEEPIKFENQFGVLRLNLKGAANQVVKSIAVTVNNDGAGAKRFLTGMINACTSEDIANGKSIAVSGTEGVIKFQTVTMDCGTEGVALSDIETAFNVVLIPIAGLTVDIVYTEDGIEKTLTKTTNSAITRSGLVNMPVLDITPNEPQPDPETDGDGSTENLNPGEGTWE